MIHMVVDSSLNADFLDMLLQWLVKSTFGVPVKTYDY